MKMSPAEVQSLKAAGFSDAAIAKAELFGLPPGTLLGILGQAAKLLLPILEQLLLGLAPPAPPAAP